MTSTTAPHGTALTRGHRRGGRSRWPALLAAALTIAATALLPAPSALGVGEPEPVAVTVSGSGLIYNPIEFTVDGSALPSGLTVEGTATCTGLVGGAAITPSLVAGVYEIDGATCAGLTLAGSGSEAYLLSIVGGNLTLRALPFPVTVSGSQTYGGVPTFTRGSVQNPPSADLVGTPTCTGLVGGTAITSTLPVGEYVIDAATCSGLSMSGPGARDFEVVVEGGAFTVTSAPLALGALSAPGGLTWKAGKTVPVKIQVFNADGSLVSDADAEALATDCRVTLSASGAQSVTEACLKYSASTDQFQFNWKLAKSPTGPVAITVAVAYPDLPSTTAATAVTLTP